MSFFIKLRVNNIRGQGETQFKLQQSYILKYFFSFLLLFGNSAIVNNTTVRLNVLETFIAIKPNITTGRRSIRC